MHTEMPGTQANHDILTAQIQNVGAYDGAMRGGEEGWGAWRGDVNKQGKRRHE